jgi:hypothetical protein
MPSTLSFLAGRNAYAHLRRNGLARDDVKLVAGAAGGPKWLALSQLDRVLFGEFFAGRTEPLHLLGSSIGSWRFATVSQKDPLAAIARFEQAYMAQRYAARPTAREVSTTSRAILHEVLPAQAAADVLAHPTHRLSFIAARSRGLTASANTPALAAGIGAAALANVASAHALNLFFERTVFFDARAVPPFFHAHDYPSARVALSPANLHDALLASGSIPFVMEGVTGIAGAPPGVYRDGGVLDYHLNVPFLAGESDGLVLFPHFGERVIPGWFDRALPWRRAHAERMANVLLIAPSPAFVASLPHGKIPDRKDFYAFTGRDDERIAYWRAVLDACRRMADELRDVLSRGRIADVVRPLA